MSFLNSSAFGVLVARGDVAGWSAVNKFGRTNNVDSGVVTDIHDGAGTNVIWDAPTAARIHAIVSTSASDDGDPVGVGARTIKVYGLTSWDTAEVSETITLNGTGSVDTVNAYVIIHRIKVVTFGTSGPNVGTITATAATDATVTATILPGQGQTQMAIYGVPSTQTLFMTRYYATILKTSGSAVSADLSIVCAEEASNFRSGYVTKQTGSIHEDGTSALVHPFDPPKSFAGPCIIKIQATGSAADVDVSAGFDAYLVDN